ncbi:MAG: hypothetical protein JOY66_02155 [Acetobacteraceae bacterium]|nr:hypothetical protein [Acetobacteraceae bacterium]
MPADDLVGRIALDAFRAAVPGGDDAVLVELEDRIVDHRVDEMAEPALAFQEPGLLLPPFSDVAGNLREADELAVAIAHRVDDRQRPEAAAVGADPPSFGLEPSDPRRGGERVLRKLRRLVLGGEEFGERLPDDLLGAVALEPGRAGIPARDASVEVDHVDRVVDDGVDEQLQPCGVFAGSCVVILRHGGPALPKGINEPVSHEVPRGGRAAQKQ